MTTSTKNIMELIVLLAYFNPPYRLKNGQALVDSSRLKTTVAQTGYIILHDRPHTTNRYWSLLFRSLKFFLAHNWRHHFPDPKKCLDKCALFKSDDEPKLKIHVQDDALLGKYFLQIPCNTTIPFFKTILQNCFDGVRFPKKRQKIKAILGYINS